MAVIFTEGFDIYPVGYKSDGYFTNPPYGKWTSYWPGNYGAGSQIYTSDRFSPSKGRCLGISGSYYIGGAVPGWLEVNFPTISSSGKFPMTSTSFNSLIMGFAWKAETWDTGINYDIVRFRNGSTTITGLSRIGSTFELYVSGGSTLITTGEIVQPNIWYYIELKFVWDGSAGSWEFRINSDVIGSGTGVQTTTGSTTVNAVRIGSTQNGGLNQGKLGYYDDLYIIDPTTGSNTDFLNSPIIRTLVPNADTAQKDFTASTGGDNYAMVDDSEGVSNSDYVAATSPGAKDVYNVSDIPESTTVVHAVTVSTASYKTGTETRGVIQSVISSGNESTLTTSGLGTTNQQRTMVVNQDPNGNITWTKAAVNNMQIGVEVI